MKKVLIHRFRHRMEPMCFVLERYGIGRPDEHGRGIWIDENDLSTIISRMKNDGKRLEAGGRLFVPAGRGRHVEMNDFVHLFRE